MAASAWTVPLRTRRLLGEGSIDLQGANYKIVFIKSHSGVMPSETQPEETMASLITAGVSDHPSITGYSLSGATLTNVSWKISGSNCVFDCQDFSISMNGVAFSDIKVALIRVDTGDRIICYATLSTAGFDVLAGNKLTITMATGGIFTLAG